VTAPPDLLLAVPNVSEGRDADTVTAIGQAFSSGEARLLDVHVDRDHNRSVFTLAGTPGELAPALLAGARETLARVDMSRHEGVHPCVGALDVAPVVHLDDATRGAACAEALLAADILARELALPSLLYGALGGGRTRAQLRRGGLTTLTDRLAGGELATDFGPRAPHPTGGVTLVAARPPLIAFNVTLGPGATLADARALAARLREGGEDGIAGLRAIGLELATAASVQVSMNVEDPGPGSLATIVAAIRERAEVAGAELVGLARASAFDGFPSDVPIPGFDPARHTLEGALEALRS
jgi:glutamate formiminotransferase/glutamate formiminotransferase/formiminotetrahydrofolate cyclodeaminase